MNQKLLTFSALFNLVLFFSPPLFAQSEASAPQQERPYVILVSFDGFRFDYAEKHEAKNLRQLGRDNVRAKGLIPGFPSNTFPNHYSIITGMYPGTHQLVNNSFFDPQRKQYYSMRDKETVRDGYYYGGIPLWSLAEQQGVKAASYFWVGSEAEIQDERPSYYYKFDDRVPNEERIRQAKKWLLLPEEERPHFITLYFSEVDHAGHKYGPDSKKTVKAVQKVDKLIAMMQKEFATLDLPLNLIFVSDHGMTKVKYKEPIDLRTYINFNLFEVAMSGTMMMFYHENQNLVNMAYKMLKGQEENFTVYLKKDFPDSLHYNKSERIGDLIVLANHPYAFGPKNSITGKGKHGYNPYQVSEMQGIFYAKGPAFKKEVVIPAFENVHIYPLIAEILDLKYDEQAIDGKIEVLKSILNQQEVN